jgi:hypothetical protein
MMSLRTALYLSLCLFAALVVASAALGAEAVPPSAAASVSNFAPLAVLDGTRAVSLAVGICALSFLYVKAWRSYKE